MCRCGGANRQRLTRAVLTSVSRSFDGVLNPNPVFVGDSLRAVSTVLTTRRLSDGRRGVVTVATVAVNQRGEEVVRSKDAVLYKCKVEGV